MTTFFELIRQLKFKERQSYSKKRWGVEAVSSVAEYKWEAGSLKMDKKGSAKTLKNC